MPVSTLPVADGQLDQLLDRLSQFPTFTIGRRADNVIVLADAKVSGQHARLIQCTNTSFVLEDLDSKNGTFVNGVRITRKVIDYRDAVQVAGTTYTVAQLLTLQRAEIPTPAGPGPSKPEPDLPATGKAPLDFTDEFADLKRVFEQYPLLRRNCRNREKTIRLGSVLLSSVVGIGAALSTGGGALALLPVMSGAGLSMLLPTLCSTLLSTDEKLEIIDKEYRERYRCPNPACRDPFGAREWELLAHQKICRRCQAIWVR